MLPHQHKQEDARAKDATPKSIRARQYQAWLSWRNRHQPLAALLMRHSANELHDHRERVSNGRADYFFGLQVMGAAS